MKINKSYISIDHPRKEGERTFSWENYPCINTKTGRRLPRRLGHYFRSWEDYCRNGNDVKYKSILKVDKE